MVFLAHGGVGQGPHDGEQGGEQPRDNLGGRALVPPVGTVRDLAHLVADVRAQQEQARADSGAGVRASEMVDLSGAGPDEQGEGLG